MNGHGKQHMEAAEKSRAPPRIASDFMIPGTLPSGAEAFALLAS